MIDPRQWSAEGWAAVAAIASAVAAIGSLRWQRREAAFAARPELVLEKFSTANEGGTRYVRAGTVRNVGSGVACAIYLSVKNDSERFSLPVAGGNAIALLQAGQDAAADFEIMMSEPIPDRGFRIWQVEATVTCWDRLGWRHHVGYVLFISPEPIGLTQPLAPGVMLAARRQVAVSPTEQRIERLILTPVRIAWRWLRRKSA